jgi:DNA-binding Xre family transcriptional regulator
MLKSHPKTLKINDIERLCKALDISTEDLMKGYFGTMEGKI